MLPIQLWNLARKLPRKLRVGLLLADSASLPVATAHYDRALVFFLLHEQPEDVRRATIAEALRVVRPGGTIVIVDYHRPGPLHPLYWPMAGVLHALEPYALALWRHEIARWLPGDRERFDIAKTTFAGGLYQLLRITR